MKVTSFCSGSSATCSTTLRKSIIPRAGWIAFYAATQVPVTALAVFYPGWLTSTEVGLSRPEPVLAAAPRPEAAADAWNRAFALLAEMFGTRNNPLVH